MSISDSLPDIALSIRQPWAWAILNAGKDIENRDWSTRRRGPIAIHAAKGMTLGEYRACLSTMREIGLPDGVDLPGVDGLERGGIVGMAEIVGCVPRSDSPWFFGMYGFVLANVRPVPFIAVRGSLGFFNWRAALRREGQ